MAMGTERSNPTHNFTMSRDLHWGSQRFLRCMSPNSGAQVLPLHHFTADSSSDQCHRNNYVHQSPGKKGSVAEILDGSFKVAPTPPSDGRPRSSGVGDDGITATREKLVMSDLQTAEDKIRNSIFKDGQITGSPSLPPAVEVEGHGPWSLRTRRAACKAPVSDGAPGRDLMVDVPPKLKSPISQMKVGFTAGADKPTRPRRDCGSKKRERAKFCALLSKSEIEEDYLEMFGHRPPRRPKKGHGKFKENLMLVFQG